MLRAHKTRARTRTHGNLKNAQNDLNRTLLGSVGHFEHLDHFDAHLRAHNDALKIPKNARQLTHDLKFMCIEFGDFMIQGYEDIDDNVICSKWRLGDVTGEGSP